MSSPSITCSRCGTTASGPDGALTWSTSVEGHGDSARTQYYCERCTRENVRSIESKLDASWW